MSEKYRCYHCGGVFEGKEAEEHFGTSTHDQPACQIDVKHLRKLEAELRRYRNEDTDLHRQVQHLQNEHHIALRRAEESGYAKGLRDGRQLK